MNSLRQAVKAAVGCQWVFIKMWVCGWYCLRPTPSGTRSSFLLFQRRQSAEVADELVRRWIVPAGSKQR